MIKKLIISALFLSGGMILKAQPGFWVPKAPFGGGSRTACTGFALGNGAVVGLGLDSADTRRSFYSYNPANDTWTQLASLGGATGAGLGRDVSMGFAVGIYGYVVGGQGSNPYFNDTWEYDPAGDTWMQKINFTPGGRRSAASFVLNSKGYICCGQDVAGLKNDLWQYDPTTNTWAQKASYTGSARRLPVSFVIGSVAYVGTGDDGTFKKDFYSYNPTSNTWTAAPNFGGTPRYGCVAFAINGKGYVGLGYDNTLNNTTDIWEYNPSTLSWTMMQPFPGTPRSNAVAIACTNGKAYIGTGYDGIPRDDWWELDPAINGIQDLTTQGYQCSIYPNPVEDQATIAIDAKILTLYREVSVSIYDLAGNEVRRIDHVNSDKTPFTRDNLGAGMYLYSIVAGNGRLATGKIIVR